MSLTTQNRNGRTCVQSTACEFGEFVVSIGTAVRETVKTFLHRKNYFISRATESGALANFLRSVRPLETNHDLIRIGGETDGGYLVPNDLEGIEACFSPGVSRCADFELDLARRGVHCFLADYSVDAPPVSHSLIHFEKTFLGQIDDSRHTTLESWVAREAPGRREFILQMDIEGGEYPVIVDTSSETLRKFRILVIEFHEMESLYDKYGFNLINLTFKKILKDFEVVHIHPNNYRKPVVYGKYEIPPYMEFTFLRKDRITRRNPAMTFPHPLDRNNVPGNDAFTLPTCWFAD